MKAARSDSMTVDMKLGTYRRQYSGFINGKRINSVGWHAEAWFWRLHALADDFGNLRVDGEYLKCYAAPRKPVSVAKAERLTLELIKANLIVVYEYEGERFGHVVDFEDLQPSPRNGRRIQRVAPYMGNPGASGGTTGSHSHSHSHSSPIPDAREAKPPPSLDSPDFVGAWGEYVKHRAQLGERPLTDAAVMAQWARLSGWGSERAIAALKHTTAMGWKNIREPESDQRHPSSNDKAGGGSTGAQARHIARQQERLAGGYPGDGRDLPT